MDETTKTEKDWYNFWEKEGFFQADPTSNKKPYSLLMPPPNLTGDPHLGHAMQHAILDALARFKRMQGFDTLLLPGVDHAGIQFESTLNKLLSKEGLHKGNMSREDWLKRAWQLKDEVYKTFHSTWSIFGISADWSREVFTLEPKVQQTVLTEFQKFWDQDLLYKGAYIVQWCPKDQTAIEDVELEYEEKKEKLYFVNYKIEDSKESIQIATTRPETIYADSGIAIYPDHPKFSKFIGQNAINPLNGNKIPIFEDQRVDKDFGTGALKITPGHDPLDYQIGADHNLPILHVVDKTGRMTKLADDLAGLKIDEAESKAEQKLRDNGSLEKTEDLLHSVPVCERCKTTIEPLISEEWFVKMNPLAEKALKNIDKVSFIPKNYQKILSDWMEGIHDWSISRSLWWGHRIPVWYCQNCNPNHLVGKDQAMTISLEEPANPCPSCKESHWVQDEQVLDTWFSSGMWPLATLGWPASQPGEPEQTPELQKYYPYDFEITAPEIKYLWIARMIMLGLWFGGNIPFKNMFFHGTLRAMDGKKMSKSLGNGVDPKDLIESWGTDATRMLLYSYSTPGRDGRLSKQLADERSKNFRNFNTKLRNISRYIIDLKPEDAKSINGDVIARSAPNKAISNNKKDQEILDLLNKTIQNVTQNLESFNLHLATEQLYEFIWHEFADIYIESTKQRRSQAQPTLEYIFRTSLELLHPFMPFITEDLWQRLPHTSKSIMITPWPKAK